MRVIGLDIGTTTLSAVVLDADTGLLLEARTVPNAATIPSARSWERLQDRQTLL